MVVIIFCDIAGTIVLGPNGLKIEIIEPEMRWPFFPLGCQTGIDEMLMAFRMEISQRHNDLSLNFDWMLGPALHLEQFE